MHDTIHPSPDARSRPGPELAPAPRPPAPRGRGAADNPANRFERLHLELDEPLPGKVATILLRDASRTILARNTSPDVPFNRSVNPYRGCEHGCSYCYARPTHEYLGFSAGLDFETRILIKEQAPELLRRELSSRRWKPQVVAMSGVTDPYQPLERELRLTRGCLEVLAEYRNPVAVITKNELVTRDVDLLSRLAEHHAASVSVSVTTLDADLARNMEPRTSTPERRLSTIAKLAAAGVPCRVMVAPVIPGLTDHEIPAILGAAADAGAKGASWVLLRLPGAVAPLFLEWLERAVPGRAGKIVQRLHELRGGAPYRADFEERMRGTGPWSEQIARLFETARRRTGLDAPEAPLSALAFRSPGQQRLPFGP